MHDDYDALPARRPSLLPAASLGVVWWLAIVGSVQAADPADSPRKHEFTYDFRGSKPLPPGIVFAGAVDDAVGQPEPEGFRITIAGGPDKKVDRVGLEIKTTLQGDFDVTAGYEILHAERPKEGYGVGFELFAHTVDPPHPGVDMFGGLGVYRVARVDQGDIHMVSYNHIKANGQPAYDQAHVPTKVRAGRLRISRIGSDATAFAADGTDGPFKELARFPLGSADVTVVWLMAFAGASTSPLDLRVRDVTIRSDAPIPLASSGDAADSARVSPAGATVSLVLAGALVILLIVGAVAYFVARSRRSAGGQNA